MVENVFDLDAFGALDKVEYELHRPDNKDEKIGLTLILAGQSHPEYQKFIEDEFRRIQKELEKVEKAKAEGKELPAEDFNLDERRKAETKLVAARILGAKNKIKFLGEVIDLTNANALQVFSHPRFVIYVPQLREFLDDQANFMPVSAKNS